LVGFSSEPHRYLAASNALCLPSYREGFGSVIIEAAAMGVPAIASNIYGISDAVQNHKTGLLHAPKNSDQLLKCMEVFLSNPDLVAEYGAAAKKRAINEFDAKILTKYWLDFYLSHIH
jgi:glycosyltransferase involved in cell wall biosynthesis